MHAAISARGTPKIAALHDALWGVVTQHPGKPGSAGQPEKHQQQQRKKFDSLVMENLLHFSHTVPGAQDALV